MKTYKLKNSIVIFKEKHAERYFIVQTFEDLCKVALKIFKERNEEGYWYDFEPMKSEEKPDISKEDAEKLRNHDLRIFTLKCWQRYEDDVKTNKSLEKEKELYNKALQDKTGEIVLQFLETRRKAEYEEWEVIESEDY